MPNNNLIMSRPFEGYLPHSISFGWSGVKHGGSQSVEWCMALVPPCTKKHEAFWYPSKGRGRKGELEVLDMMPVCNKCGKTAPIDEKMSTDNWTVYRVKEPCECGGKFLAKFMVEKTGGGNS